MAVPVEVVSAPLSCRWRVRPTACRPPQPAASGSSAGTMLLPLAPRPLGLDPLVGGGAHLTGVTSGRRRVMSELERVPRCFPACPCP